MDTNVKRFYKQLLIHVITQSQMVVADNPDLLFACYFLLSHLALLFWGDPWLCCLDFLLSYGRRKLIRVAPEHLNKLISDKIGLFQLKYASHNVTHETMGHMETRSFSHPAP